MGGGWRRRVERRSPPTPHPPSFFKYFQVVRYVPARMSVCRASTSVFVAQAQPLLHSGVSLLSRSSYALMGLDLVEIQQTDRYFVFGARATSCKVHWPSTTAVSATREHSSRPSSASAQSSPTLEAREERPSSEMASEGSAASSVVSVGARKVLPEDVLLVAVHGARVDLHPASLEKACPVSCNPPRGGDKAFEIRYERTGVNIGL